MGKELHNMKTADRKKFLKIRARINFCRRWFEVNVIKNERSKLISKYKVLNFYRMKSFLKKHPDFSGFFPSAR
jgi:hypothetical protein